MHHAHSTVISVKSSSQPYVRTPTLAQTTCPYCGVGCGVDVTLQASDKGASQATAVTGSPEHPANYGRLCVKGTNLLETNDLNGRLLTPLVNNKRASWDEATTNIADKLAAVIREHGPDAVAFYVSGQLLTEDYYVANKLMKGYLGSANIDTNSRLCMSSAVASYKRAFGEDIVPCHYDDLESTDLLIFVGSNAAWTHPVLFQRIERAKRRNPNMQIMIVDPRSTETATLADCHLAIKPGTDAILFNGLLCYLAVHHYLDEEFIGESTQGLDEALASASVYTPQQVADECDVPLADVLAFYDAYGSSPTAITFYSMGINQSSTGTDKGNAIINCHLASGKIGKPGCGPFSITGQPNAMGGREVGGLANMLAAHMDIDNPVHTDRVQRFWQSPTIASKPGLKAVDLFKQMNQGKIKFVWIMATNPVVSMPNRQEIEGALRQCEMVVVSDIVTNNDTLNFAHIALPATGWSEKNGTVTNSERRISRQRGILPAPGEARHDWQALCDVAKKMGFEEGFNYTHPAQIFREHAALTAFENEGERALNLAGLTALSQREYDNLRSVQWPVLSAKQATAPSRLFADGRFYTANGKARFVAITPVLPAQQTSSAYPFLLNSGRSRDQWHTMTRTGKAPALLKHAAFATLSLHPQDGRALGLEDGSLVAIKSAVSGKKPMILPVVMDDKLRKQTCFAPIHWSAVWGSHLTLGAMFDGSCDGISGQPELKQGAVSLRPVTYAYEGQMVGADLALQSKLCSAFDYWAKTTLMTGEGARIATDSDLVDIEKTLVSQLPKQWVITGVKSAQNLVLIAQYDNTLQFALWLNPIYEPLPFDWLEDCLGQSELADDALAAMLRSTADDTFLQGKVVCSCFSVREKTIETAIKEGCDSVGSLGETLKCGTNCGSCKPELKTLIDKTRSTIPVKAVTKEVILHD